MGSLASPFRARSLAHFIIITAAPNSRPRVAQLHTQFIRQKWSDAPRTKGIAKNAVAFLMGENNHVAVLVSFRSATLISEMTTTSSAY